MKWETKEIKKETFTQKLNRLEKKFCAGCSLKEDCSGECLDKYFEEE